MSFVAEDLSTTYHERYKWCSAYLKGLTDLKTNPERYADPEILGEHLQLMVNTGARDERAKTALPNSSYHCRRVAADVAASRIPGYLKGSVPARPLRDSSHAVLVNDLATLVLSAVDRLDYAALVYANERNN